MSSFTAHLRAMLPESSDSTPANGQQHDGHALPPPTPADMTAVFRFVRDQFGQLEQDAPTEENRNLLRELMSALNNEIDAPPEEIHGVTQQYLDSLDRVPRKKLKKDDACPICADPYLEQEDILVVQLPCHGSHKFDLECVAPWLLSKGTCPMCRKDLTVKKKVEIPKDEEEEDGDQDMMYA
jgi:hypothetical protein